MKEKLESQHNRITNNILLLKSLGVYSDMGMEGKIKIKKYLEDVQMRIAEDVAMLDVFLNL